MDYRHFAVQLLGLLLRNAVALVVPPGTLKVKARDQNSVCGSFSLQSTSLGYLLPENLVFIVGGVFLAFAV